MASDAGARLAQIALTYPPCSARGPDDAGRARYASLLIRPSDPATTAARAYYLNNPSLSTCALAVLSFWRLAGLDDPAVTGPYFPSRIGRAFSDVLATGVRYGAWEGAGLTGPLLAGDVWVITDASGGDGHMGMCVADQDSATGPAGTLATVEGGQFDGKGSTAVGAFSRVLVERGATGLVMRPQWQMGSRYVLGVVRAGLLPLPDVAAPDTEDPAT